MHRVEVPLKQNWSGPQLRHTASDVSETVTYKTKYASVRAGAGGGGGGGYGWGGGGQDGPNCLKTWGKKKKKKTKKKSGGLGWEKTAHRVSKSLYWQSFLSPVEWGYTDMLNVQ